MPPRRLSSLLLLAALALAAPARAHPCSGAVDEARRHLDRGLSLFDKKQFVDAAAEFDAAYKAQPYSAFLCNAAMAYEQALDFPSAILRYKAFLAAEPSPPDLARIKATLAWIEAQNAAQLAARPAEAAPPPPPPLADPVRAFRSQVVVESDPPGAPLSVYARRDGAAAWKDAGPNPGWEVVASGMTTPRDLSLGAGEFHVVIDAFRDYKRSETDLTVVAGRVYEFKANLSQGTFLGFLRVLSAAPGARVYLDDPPPHHKPPWGRAPHGALVESGAHRVWIAATGYEEASQEILLAHGQAVEIAPPLTRLGYGYLRVDGNADVVKVRVDGELRGAYSLVGEPLRVRLAAGRHRIELEASGRKTYDGLVDVPGGQEVGVHGRLSFSPSRSTAVVSGALAVGAAVGGVLLLRQAAQPVPKDTGDTGSPLLFRIGGGVSLGLSGVLGAVSLYGAFADPTPASRAVVDKPVELPEDEPRPAPLALLGPRVRFAPCRVEIAAGPR